jgi:hypothetical protein
MDKAEKIRKGQLKCWCCGECVTEQFALVSMLEETRSRCEVQIDCGA